MTSLDSRRARLRSHDAGSIVFGWLGRVTIVLTILAIVGFEVLSIAIAHVTVEDIGRTAADRALSNYSESHNAYAAYAAADTYVTENGAVLVKKSFTISNESVSFELKKTAPTLLVFRFDATADLADVKTTIYEEPIEQGGSMP